MWKWRRLMMGGAVVPQRFDLKYMLNLDTVSDSCYIHTISFILYLHEVFQNLRWKDVGLWRIFLTNYLYLHSFWKGKGIIPMNDQYMRLQCLDQIHRPTRWSHLLLKHPLYTKLSFALVTMANNSFPSSYPWTSLGWWIMRSLPLSLGNLTERISEQYTKHLPPSQWTTQEIYMRVDWN